MKKLFLVLAAAMVTVSVSAQKTAITSNKAQDNWYVGVNAGIDTYTKAKGDLKNGFFKSIAPTVGIRVGKNLTTVFGLAAEGDVIFKSNKKWYDGSKTFFEGISADLFGTFNLSNLFGGYKGEPRFFEVIALGGFGWEHDFNHLSKTNAINSRFAVDFAFNFGADKEWQAYIEPSLTYNLHNWVNGIDAATGAVLGDMSCNGFNYNLNKSYVGLKAGLNYKFGNSNGSHNFKIEQLRDQAEIDGLNARINGLRSELDGKDAALAAKDRQIADLQKALDECNAKPKYVKPETATNLQPTVLFRQGKSTIDKAQYAPIELIAHYMKNHPEANVEIKGYASPEGKPEFNQKLSEARAQAVKDALVKKYKIDAARLTTKGMGATDKLFEQVEFNRVATFNDNAKAE